MTIQIQKIPETCSHMRKTAQYVEREHIFTGEIEGEWQEYHEWTTVDIDTHRYRCTQCNKIMYYSGRAREFYEEGKGSLP